MTEENDARPSAAPKIPRQRARDAESPAPGPNGAAPHPGAVRQDMADPTLIERRLTLKGAPVTIALIVIMTAIEGVIYAASLGDAPIRNDVFRGYAFFGNIMLGVLEGYVPAIEAYRLVSHQFLHGMLLHLGLNMLALAMIGGPLERAGSALSYFALFILCGVAGAFAQLGWAFAEAAYFNAAFALQIPMVGASGAIFGLLGATFGVQARMLAAIPRANRARSPAAFLAQASVTIVLINVALEMLGPIAGAAHLGGFFAGMALGPLMIAGRNRSGPREI